jgi:hypothetical protein
MIDEIPYMLYSDKKIHNKRGQRYVSQLSGIWIRRPTTTITEYIPINYGCTLGGRKN